MANKWDDEVEEAYAQLRESFASGKTRSLEWRKDQLQKFKTMMNEQRKFFETCMQCDLHKSPEEGYLYEVNPVMHEVQQCIDHLRSGLHQRRKG